MHERNKLKETQDQAAEVASLLRDRIDSETKVTELDPNILDKYEGRFARRVVKENESDCCSFTWGCFFKKKSPIQTAVETDKKTILPDYRV